MKKWAWLIFLIMFILVILLFIRQFKEKSLEARLPEISVEEPVQTTLEETRQNLNILNLAIQTKDILLCSQIIDLSLKEVCEDNLTNIAIAEKDSSICKSHMTCYVKYGASTGDIQVCERIMIENITKVIGKEGEVLNITNLQLLKDECYSKMAVELKDLSVCAKVKDEDFRKSWCEDIIKK